MRIDNTQRGYRSAVTPGEAARPVAAGLPEPCPHTGRSTSCATHIAFQQSTQTIGVEEGPAAQSHPDSG